MSENWGEKPQVSVDVSLLEMEDVLSETLLLLLFPNKLQT